jgi:uncharacterized protein YbcI
MAMPKSDPISGKTAGAPGEVLSQISNRMVQIHKQYYGKGPTKARSYVMGDLVVCLMRGGFTRAEETLIGSGRAGLVHEQRSEFQEALKREFTSAISEITGREVVAFMSNSHDEPPLIVEMFLLEPGAGEELREAAADGNGLRRDGDDPVA